MRVFFCHLSRVLSVILTIQMLWFGMFHNMFQVLTLASNERVPLTSSMRLVFEISHLRTATPATVSRAGILYINHQDLGWNPWVTQFVFSQYQSIFKVSSAILFFYCLLYHLLCLMHPSDFVKRIALKRHWFRSWLDQHSDIKWYLGLLLRYVASWIDQREHQTERAHLTILFEKYVPRCVEQMRNTFKTITPIPENSMVQVRNKQAHTGDLLLLCAYRLVQSANPNKIFFFLFRHSALCLTAF